MNKRQKQVIQSQLNDEKATLNKLKGIYKKALDDVDDRLAALKGRAETENLQSVIYQIQYQEALKKQINGILDTLNGDQFSTISEYLAKSYESGFVGTMYDIHGQGVPLIFPIDQEQVVQAVTLDTKLSKPLYNKLGEDVKLLKKRVANNISRGIAQGQSYSDIAKNIAVGMVGNYARMNGGALYNAMRITRTEAHRISQQAAYDALKKAKDNGADVVKQWDATLDKRTRPSHARVDGEIRELDEPFSNGLMKPGDPRGRAAEVINCRCQLLQRAKCALDEDELDELKDRAAYFGLDKTADFEEFRQKYMQSSDQLADPPICIAGVNCTVTKGAFGFHDGRGGVAKTIQATTYETPDGTKFVFPAKYIKAQQQMTPEQAIRCWNQVPAEIRSKAQKTIEFVDYYNPADSYWRKKYKNFPHSYATGGTTITFYRYDYPHQDDYVVRTYCHEASHLIDTTISTQGNRFSSESLWTKAMKDDTIVSGKKSPTTYGENSSAEDFAESVAEFVKDEAGFTSQFPNRAKIIKSIIKKVI